MPRQAGRHDGAPTQGRCGRRIDGDGAGGARALAWRPQGAGRLDRRSRRHNRCGGPAGSWRWPTRPLPCKRPWIGSTGPAAGAGAGQLSGGQRAGHPWRAGRGVRLRLRSPATSPGRAGGGDHRPQRHAGRRDAGRHRHAAARIVHLGQGLRGRLRHPGARRHHPWRGERRHLRLARQQHRAGRQQGQRHTGRWHPHHRWLARRARAGQFRHRHRRRHDRHRQLPARRHDQPEHPRPRQLPRRQRLGGVGRPSSAAAT